MPSNLSPKTPSKTCYTIVLTEEQSEALESWCDRRAWAFYKVPYARFAFKGEEVSVVMYNSGKLVVQGRKTENFVTYVLETEITHNPQLGLEKVHHPEWFQLHAGLDESGKGDFFGPLVTACVIADGAMVEHWLKSGLRESKQVTSDLSVFKLEQLIRHTPNVVVEISFANMDKYNQLYEKFGNLNRLLAWFHAKSLENALRKRWAPEGLLDQFTAQPLVQDYLKNFAPHFQLKQRVRAESDPVVAAASIIARAEYLRQLKQLSQEAKMQLPKGSGAKVPRVAQALVETLGKEQLRFFAKLHFKTTANL